MENHREYYEWHIQQGCEDEIPLTVQVAWSLGTNTTRICKKDTETMVDPSVEAIVI